GDVWAEARALRVDERADVFLRVQEELIERVHLPPVRVATLVRVRQASRNEQVPELLQTALLAPQRLLRRGGVFDGKHDVRPVEGRESEARLFAVGDGERAER